MRSLSGQIAAAGREVQSAAGRAVAAWNGLDWEARQKAGAQGQVSSAQSLARSLASQAEAMARYLTARASAFDEADRQGVAAIGSLLCAYTQLERQMAQGPVSHLSFPFDLVRRIEGLGKLLQPVTGALIVASSIRLGHTYAGEVIIDLPSVLTDFGFKLREIRTWAGLSGYLNHIKYTSIPGHIAKVGILTSIPIIAWKWFNDAREYQGTKLASALVVDAGLTLAPVAGGFAGAKVGMMIGAAIGSIFPGVGTVAGGAAGAIVGGVAGSLATGWAIDQSKARETGIDLVDRTVMAPVADLIGRRFFAASTLGAG